MKVCKMVATNQAIMCAKVQGKIQNSMQKGRQKQEREYIKNCKNLYYEGCKKGCIKLSKNVWKKSSNQPCKKVCIKFSKDVGSKVCTKSSKEPGKKACKKNFQEVCKIKYKKTRKNQAAKECKNVARY